MLKLTIITINKNNCEGLRCTLDSVVNQTFQDFEYIVIDGASTDGSAELIKEYSRIDYWVSEPDTGIYNAMNKGIAKANGEYLLFLNSGDTLFKQSTLMDLFNFHFCADIVYGFNARKHGNVLRIVHEPAEDQLTFTKLIFSPICHQSILFKKRLFDIFGGYNEALFIASDIDFLASIYLSAKHTFQRIPQVIAFYAAGGISDGTQPNSAMEAERAFVMNKHAGAFSSDIKRLQQLEDVYISRGVRTVFALNLAYRKIRRLLKPL